MLKKILPALLIAVPALACPPSDKSLYNDPIMWDLRQEETPDFDREAVNKALDLVDAVYGAYLRPAGVEFKVRRFFDTTYKNAHPQREGSNWYADLYGGLFHKPINKYSNADFATLVACHEIGHHLGGTVFYPGTYFWAAGEGQSDYYASLKCLRRVYQEQDNAQWLVDFEAGLGEDTRLSEELALAKTTCEATWTNTTEQLICIRSAVSGYMMVVNFRPSENNSIATPSKDVASSTSYYYPSMQCRLDSMVNGARCSLDYTLETSQTDHKVGNCDETEPAGMRPVCWFAGIKEEPVVTQQL